jgi:hypothetical protein
MLITLRHIDREIANAFRVQYRDFTGAGGRTRPVTRGNVFAEFTEEHSGSVLAPAEELRQLRDGEAARATWRPGSETSREAR